MSSQSKLPETPSKTGCKTLALLRVNPFRSPIQLVICGSARAASSDGRHWEIQVYADRPLDLWASGAGSPRQGLFRFGRWTPEQGLARVPINPILDNGQILPAAERLLAELGPARRLLPFPLADRWEHWLLDRSGAPLALIASTMTIPNQQQEETPAWTTDLPGTDCLQQAVRDAAGPHPRARWLQRPSSSSPANGPPMLPLRPPDHHPKTTAAYAEWRSRLAPRLLTLPWLDDATRAELEKQAAGQALALARYWRLYPKIIDRRRLRQALVEARLRRAAAPE